MKPDQREGSGVTVKAIHRVLGAAILAAAFAPVSATQARAPAPPVELAGIPVALMVDSGSGQVLYARQPDLSFVPASMTKVMTAYVAFEEMAAGRLSPARVFTISPETARQWGGRGSGLRLAAGTRISADMLLHAITTVSANDASAALAQGYSGSIAGWAALMNAEARRLGMTHSHFATANGWPDNGATYVSARDLATLGKALIARHPDRYRAYFGQKRLTWNGVTQENHDPTVGVVPGADGIKTGFTREAGFNFLGSALRDDRRLFMVIAGAKSEGQRAAAARAFLEWGFAQWRARPLFAAGAHIADARVQDGAAAHVPLIAAAPIAAAVPATGQARLALKLIYTGPLVAPVAKGTKVADLEIRVDDLPPARVALLAGASVARAGPVERLLNGLRGLFA